MVPDPGISAPGRQGLEPPTAGLKSGMIAVSPQRPMDTPIAAAFHSNAHTGLLFVGTRESNPAGSRRCPVYDQAPDRTPKRKKPPRFPWVAPLLGMVHLLLERSPPSGVLVAILGLDDLAWPGAHAWTHRQRRTRDPRPCLFGSGQGVRARCEFRELHGVSRRRLVLVLCD
jgi:hypothetical protein